MILKLIFHTKLLIGISGFDYINLKMKTLRIN